MINKLFFHFILSLLIIIITPALSTAHDNISLTSTRTLKSASELDYPPFSIIKEDGTADGFSVDLLKAVAHAVGLDINFKVGPWHEIKQDLMDGKLDLLPLVSYSKKRDKVFDFTAPYLRMHGSIFARKDDKSINSEADLKEKEIIVMKGDTAHEYVIENKLSNKLILTETFEEAMALLSSGKHDAVIVQHLVGHQILKKLNISNVTEICSFKETNLKPAAKPLSGFEQKFCFAVKQGDTELLALLNEGLAIVTTTGVYNELYNKWFAPVLPSAPVSMAHIFKYLILTLLPVLFLMGVLGIWYLKREVAKKTKFLEKEIIDREQAKQALKESEEKFKDLFEKAPLSYQSLDENGNFTEINETWLRTLGYNEDEVIGKNFSEFLVPEWKDHFAVNFPQFKAVGEVLGVEFEMIKKDGSTILVSFQGKIGKNLKGDFERTHCVFNDITVERSAQISQEIELILNKAIAGISKELLSDNYDIIVISDMLIEYAKKLTKSKYGFVSSVDNNTFENVGNTLTEIFSGKWGSKKTRAAFPIRKDGKYNELWDHGLNTNKAFFTNTLHKFTEYNDLPDTHVHINNFLAVPVIIGESLIGLIALADSDRDYTDHDIRAMERLSEIFSLAIHRKEQETEKIKLEQNLLELQKIEAIGALAGGIAHDFNNILFPIVGYAEMLKEDLPENSDLHDNANEILAGAKRAKDLVQQILAFSRQAEQEIIPLKPHLIIKEVIKLSRAVIPTSIKIKQFIDTKTSKILADPTQIHQVAMNLITNAYHAMQETGGILTIKLQNTETIENIKPSAHSPVLPDTPHILLSISDTGTGMDKNTIKKIFNPYFTTKPKGKGTGLGLSVVHGIIKNCGGDISINSSPGKGTTFDIYIPAFRKGLEPDKKERKIDIIPKGNESILLVDDEESILKTGQMILERLGYKVETVNSSLEALKIIKAGLNSFDLVISDMTMPDMTGDKLAEEILKAAPDLPIIISTGFSEQLSLEKAHLIGVKALMMKPIIKSKMAVTVREVLDKVK